VKRNPRVRSLRVSFPGPGTVASRITVTVMMLLLACGGPATMAVGSWLNVTFILAQAGPIHEEEEERHAGHGTTATSGRRASPSITSQRAACRRAAHGRATSERRPALAHVPTHRDADLRNGLGTPLRC
jgi:hypothetical protein